MTKLVKLEAGLVILYVAFPRPWAIREVDIETGKVRTLGLLEGSVHCWECLN